MPSLGDELREALKNLEPARRIGREVLRMEGVIQAAILAADKVVDLEARRHTLETESVALEARFKEQREAREHGHAERIGVLEAEIRAAETQAQAVKDRVGKEARDFIAAREVDRHEVVKAIQAAQRDLQAVRVLTEQAEQDRRSAHEKAESEWSRRRQIVDGELAMVESRLASRRKEYEDIQARLQALMR